MASNEWVEIVHPDLPGQTATVHRRSVPQHAKAGWREKAQQVVDPVPVELETTNDEPGDDPVEEGD